MKRYIKCSKNIYDIKFEYRIEYPSDPNGEFGTRIGDIEEIIRWDKYFYDINEQHHSRVYVPSELKNAFYGRVGMRVYTDDDLNVLE